MSRPARPGPDWGAVWPAPAKLNLMLRILGRRADGYHELQTAFQFLDYCDELRFLPRDDGRITRPLGLAGLPEDEDLVVRAAALLRKETGCRRGAEIHVAKRIPEGGGLGGGSSDAATTLVALDHYWDTGLGRERLQELGASLGADLPVFVGGQASWAEGIGDRLTPLTLEEPWYLVIAPGCRVPTAEVFRDPGLTRNSAPITISRFLAQGGGNDCTEVVRRRYPAVAEALDWLGRFAPARLTGTGACVFAAFDDEKGARDAGAQVPSKWLALVAAGRNRSPLLDFT
ncbi:MAG: 4-(cytidine 5'-diphospho)-2-C-methyl-D-erythritol kinase [Gammaproteobacteria bacterium]|jgi:4-diphosphocytidyl-2-C-methyl-D-erythritol kinase